MTGPDVFLSYNREDQAAAKRFAEAFEAAGLSVWWDVTLRSGEAYDQVTEEALRTAKAVVVLWSPRSVVSRWVRAEATLADRNRTLVPARIEACALPIMFELTQTAELSHWHGKADDPMWLGFLGDVRRIVGITTLREPAANMSQAQPPAKRQSAGSRASIAILPFINRSDLREDDIFANGMVDDLTVALSLTRQIKVVAASATAAYRKDARDLRQIGQDLGVRYLLEGNVRRIGDHLRVTAQLVEAKTDNILWTQKFDRPLAELAELQEELASEVAAHLGVEVQRAELERALRKPGDITAWEALLRSDAHLFRGTLAGREAAVAEAKRAVAIDPEYGAAYAVLAAAQAVLLPFRGKGDPALEAELAENARRAQSFDPSNPLVLCRLAAAHNRLGRFDDALLLIERAIAQNPNIEILHIEMATTLVNLGRPEEALAEIDAAEGLARNSLWATAHFSNRSFAHLQAGRLSDALMAAEKWVRTLAVPEALVPYAVCLAATDQWDRARDNVRRMKEMDPNMSFANAEGLFRSHYGTAKGVDEFVSVLRKLWDEIEERGP
jgi:TolB-like protein